MAHELGEDRFNWKLASYLTGCGLFAVMVIELCDAFDILEMLYFLALVPLIGLILLLLAIFSAVGKRQRQCLSILLALVTYCGTSWLLWKTSMDLNMNLRPAERWLLHSRAYKAEVLAQPSPQNGELRHIEWDGWGFAGLETNVYLVYDPSDSLLHAAKNHSPGKFTGIPCEVPTVRHLESRWYSVVFYTETSWEHCS
jgi:hypothetical protein